MFKYFILVVIGISLQFTLGNIQDDLSNFNLNSIAANISEISGIHTEDVEKAFAEKCCKLAGEKAYYTAMEARNKTIDCIRDLVDLEEFQREMALARPSGDLDVVFKKYCKKTPEFRKCMTDFVRDFEPCLDQEERQRVRVVLNVTEQLAEFVCFKDGDRIALFIAEGGPECINYTRPGLNSCLEQSFQMQMNNRTEFTASDIPQILLKPRNCANFQSFHTCVVRELETCDEPTPSNLVDSLFTFIYKSTPCAIEDYLRTTTTAMPKVNRSGSSSISSSFFHIFIIIGTIRFLTLY